ncbi:MAG: cyclic nucleotide-binding domain-containing protein [Salinisphaera sp.]|uniref:Crp/Fnr family transcriptional regulator n=1 Tax=Salinisphaera sp. TaxID=1914330 RepID=UPI003C7B36B1
MAKKIEKLLAEQSFFSDFSRKDLSFLADAAERQTLNKNRVLFNQRTPAHEFYFVLSGLITLQVPAIEGPALMLQKVGAGSVLGWSWLIPPYEWSFQAEADEDSELLVFDGQRILARCEAEPAFGYEVMKRFSTLMSDRLAYSRERMMAEWNPPGFA